MKKIQVKEASFVAKKKISVTRKNASNKLKKAQLLMEDDMRMQKRKAFINKFVLCEIACKHIIEAYKRHKKDLKPGEHVTLDMRFIPAALNAYGYDIPRHILSDIFSGGKKRGSKSAKKLRDGIMHAMNEDDLTEIVDREDFLHNRMDEFLKYFE